MNKDSRLIKKRIRDGLESSTPNVLPEVLHYMKTSEGGFSMVENIKPIKEINKEIKEDKKLNSSPKATWLRVAASLAAVLVLVIACGVYSNCFLTESTINFDVNPSIEMKVSHSEKVLAVKPLNDNARVVLGDMKLKNIDLDIALNALIGSMVKNGYISSAKNSILISVDSSSKDQGQALQKRLTEEIDILLQQYSVVGSVLSQNIDDDRELQELAEKYKISTGKASLIKSFIQMDGRLDFADLASLSINDLNLLLKDKYVLEGIKKTGEASDGYIGKEKALALALVHLGVKEADIRELEIEIDYKKKRMIYEIEFKTADKEYEIDIDAQSGEVLEVEIETLKKAPSSTGSSSNYIGESAAKSIAFKDAGVSESQSSSLKVELDRQNGIMVYEVEFIYSGYKYEYDIDALSGKILEIEKERIKESSSSQKTSPPASSPPKESSPQTNYIGESSAKSIAFKDAGVSESQVSSLKVELDRKNGIMVYEVEFIYSGYEYEYDIDAVSGKILGWEKERG